MLCRIRSLFRYAIRGCDTTLFEVLTLLQEGLFWITSTSATAEYHNLRGLLPLITALAPAHDSLLDTIRATANLTAELRGVLVRSTVLNLHLRVECVGKAA